jgi:hypothetical protein
MTLARVGFERHQTDCEVSMDRVPIKVDCNFKLLLFFPTSKKHVLLLPTPNVLLLFFRSKGLISPSVRSTVMNLKQMTAPVAAAGAVSMEDLSILLRGPLVEVISPVVDNERTH